MTIRGYDAWKTRSPDDDVWQMEDDPEPVCAFVPGDRVINMRGERATVVARNARTPTDRTPVVYDNDDAANVWDTQTDRLRLLGDDE